MPGLTIGKFAAAEGVGVETVRFYQRRGLLALPERQGSGFREYSEADRWRLAFIRRARKLGFTLSEIGDLLGPAEARSTGDIIRAAEAKLETTEKQLAELALLRCRLRRLIQICEHGDGEDCVTLHLGHENASNTLAALATPLLASPRRGRVASCAIRQPTKRR